MNAGSLYHKSTEFCLFVQIWKILVMLVILFFFKKKNNNFMYLYILTHLLKNFALIELSVLSNLMLGT
jgi:hypothetical protein